MTTIEMQAMIEIERPAADVWQVLADYGRDPEWRTGVQAMVPTPAGEAQQGTTTSETLRLAGRTWHNDGEVTSVDPGRRFTWRTVTGADAEGARSVVTTGDGSCLVELELRVRPHGFEKAMAPLLRRMLQKNLRADLARLQALVTAGRDAPSLV